MYVTETSELSCTFSTSMSHLSPNDAIQDLQKHLYHQQAPSTLISLKSSTTQSGFLAGDSCACLNFKDVSTINKTAQLPDQFRADQNAGFLSRTLVLLTHFTYLPLFLYASFSERSRTRTTTSLHALNFWAEPVSPRNWGAWDYHGLTWCVFRLHLQI